MKFSIIFVLFTLSVMVNAWWAAAAHPAIVSLGVALGTIATDVLQVESIEW